MDYNKPSCKYSIGDLIQYDERDFIVIEVQNKFALKEIVVYKLMRLGTNRTASWFATDIDANSRLLS